MESLGELVYVALDERVDDLQKLLHDHSNALVAQHSHDGAQVWWAEETCGHKTLKSSYLSQSLKHYMIIITIILILKLLTTKTLLTCILAVDDIVGNIEALAAPDHVRCHVGGLVSLHWLSKCCHHCLHKPVSDVCVQLINIKH